MGRKDMIKRVMYGVFFIFFLFYMSSCGVGDKPRVVSTSVKNGDVISDAESFDTILITFSTPMNRYITESGIKIEGYYDKIHYEWEDADRVCVLHLLNNLDKGVMYTLKIDKSCESKDGVDLGNSMLYRFYTYTKTGEFKVIDTTPTDGSNIGSIDDIIIKFSQPVDYLSVYDNIEISPEIEYQYSFSNDRIALHLRPTICLEKNTQYRVTVSSGFYSVYGNRFDEDFIFSFSTSTGGKKFGLTKALMINKGDTNYDTYININTSYLSKTHGVEKNMDLVLFFNSDFSINSVSDYITVEPAIPMVLKKEATNIRVNFTQDMISEEAYTVSIGSGFKDINGNQLDEDYKFSWVSDGESSGYLSPIDIYVKDPDGINDTLIYDSGVSYHNESMLLKSGIDHEEVRFQIKFSSPIEVYRALDCITLDFMFGNSQASSGDMTDYLWDNTGNTLYVMFSLPVITTGDDAYYLLKLNGGDDGILDINKNPIEEDISIYTVYDVQ